MKRTARIRAMQVERERQKRELSRRDFMRAAGCAALTTTSLVSTIWDLRMVNAPVADRLSPRAASGYKAMVCIFLFGGNDANNLIVPTDNARYNQYNTARPAI